LEVDGFVYDVWHPSDDQDVVETDIAGNITQSIREMLGNETDQFLYPLVNSSGLDLADIPEPRVEKIANVSATCPRDDLPENCNPYSIVLSFEHNGQVDEGILKGRIVEVASLLTGNLVAYYRGAESVRSNQQVEFGNAQSVEPEDEATFCGGIFEFLSDNGALDDYEVLGLECDFNFVPSDLRNRRLRRQLQQSDPQTGDLEIMFEVTGQYTPPSREKGDSLRGGFGTLIEDSINRDQGKGLVKTLEKRSITSVTGSTVVAVKLPDPPAPVRPPQKERGPKPEPPPPEEPPGPSAGTIVVVLFCVGFTSICSLVCFIWYKGQQRVEEPYDDEMVNVEGELVDTIEFAKGMPDDVSDIRVDGLGNPKPYSKKDIRESMERDASPGSTASTSAESYEGRLRRKKRDYSTKRTESLDDWAVKEESRAVESSLAMRLDSFAGPQSSLALRLDSFAGPQSSFDERLKSKIAGESQARQRVSPGFTWLRAKCRYIG
jgi:hypothetical protein